MQPSVILTGIRYALIELALVSMLFIGSSSPLMGQGYSDVAPQQGLDFTIPVQVIDFGTGVSFHDFDGDGWDDLTFANVNDSLIFYRNVNGTLQRLPSVVNGAGDTKHVLWADIDNDGDSDLLVTTFEGPVRLFRNDGNWNFVDITSTSGFVSTPGKRWGASFGDYDRDGFLDLYVCTYIYAQEPFDYTKLNHLYRNNGNGTFTDVTLQAGVGNGLFASFQSAWVDFNLDGWPDLYVINDFAGVNALYRNNGNGAFTDMAVNMGLGQAGEHPMSISLCDFDLDGDLDLFMTNTGIFPVVNNARSMLMVNNGDGTFAESSASYGLNIFEWGWGALWVDHDNDGYQDLYIATHRELSPAVPNLFYKNAGGQSFALATYLFPDPQITSSHAVARGDIDRDGYADIVVQNQAPYPPYLWKNEGGNASYVRITVNGTTSNRQAIGSWIRVYAGGKEHIHYTVCGENYLGQNSQHILFGLHQASVIDSVVVKYLSGHVDRYYDLAVNAEYSFREGDSLIPVVTASGPLQTCSPNGVVLDAGVYDAYLWNTGYTGRYLSVSASGNYQVDVVNEFGVVLSSGTVEVVVHPSPVIVAERQDPACAGEFSGTINLVNLAGVAPQSVVWNSGGQGASQIGLPAGQYTYTYTDVNGCTAIGNVSLIDPDPLFVLVEPTGATSGDNGIIAWTIFGGTPPHTVSVNGTVAPGNSLTGLAPGVYSVLVTDSRGCTFPSTAFVSGTVGIDTFVESGMRVFPNPVNTRLYVEAPFVIHGWHVMDATGRVLLSGRVASGQCSMDVSGISAGTYILQVLVQDGATISSRFLRVP